MRFVGKARGKWKFDAEDCAGMLIIILAMLKKIVIWLVAIAFPLNLIFNSLYSQALYDMGVAIILDMQKYSTPLLDAFFILFTILVDPLLITSACCLFILATKRKLTAFITVIFILFNTYFLTITKSFYSAPRPYWTHEHVRNIGYYCPKDYGNPSGHAEFVAVITLFIFEFLDKKKQIGYAFLAVFLMTAVSFSRMYLGGHSLDQVIQGLFLGLSLSILYVHGGLKEFIRDLLIKQGRKTYRTMLYVIIGSMHVLYIWAYWANNQHAIEHKKAAKVWVKNYNHKCGKDIDEHYLNLVMLNLNAILVNVITGLILGFNHMLTSKAVVPYMKGQWKFNTRNYPNKIVAYLIFFAVQAVLFSVGFIAFSPIVFVFGKNRISWFVYFNLAGLVSSYVYASWTLNVLGKLEVLEML